MYVNMYTYMDVCVSTCQPTYLPTYLPTAIEQIPLKRVTAANVHHDRIVAPVSVLTSHRFYEEMQGVHPTILNSEARIPDLVNVGNHRNWSNRGRTSQFI